MTIEEIKTMNTDKTPETDEQAKWFVSDEWHEDHGYVQVAFARKLERERDEARAEAASEERWANQYKAERDKAREVAEFYRDASPSASVNRLP